MGLQKNFMFKSGGGDNDLMNAATTKAAAEPVKEKEFFDLKLNEVDAKAKIKIIKEVRAITNLGLKEVGMFVIVIIIVLFVFNVILLLLMTVFKCTQYFDRSNLISIFLLLFI